MSNDEPAHAHTAASECQICPICMGLATLRQARPEVLEHLMKAGTELMLAARALLEAGEATGPARRQDGRQEGMQRISVG
jgi:hypothetical protein